MLSVMVNNQPYFCHLSNVMIQSKWKIPFKKLNIENSTNFSLNPKTSKIAYSTQDGSVFLMPLYNQSFNFSSSLNNDPNEVEKTEIFGPGNEVVHLFWINDFTELCSIKRDGELFLWNIEDNSIFNVKVPNLINAVSAEFDDVTKTLLCLNGVCLINVSFCTLFPPLCLTSTSVYLVSTGKILASIHSSTTQFNDIIVLPPDLFPISKAAESPDSDLAIYGGSCLVTITDKKLFLTRISDVTALCWCNRKLHVFCTSFSSSSGRENRQRKSRPSQSSTMVIFSKELVNLGSISSPHLAETVSSSSQLERIVISNRHLLSVFDFDSDNVIQKPPGSKFMESHIGWDTFSLTLTTFTINETILDATCGFGGDIWIHIGTKNSASSASSAYNFDYVNKSSKGDIQKSAKSNDQNLVVIFPSLAVVEVNADKVWRQSRTDLLFVEKFDTVKIFLPDSQLLPFELFFGNEPAPEKCNNGTPENLIRKSDRPLCCLGPDFIFLKPDLLFGTFPFSILDFAFRIMEKELVENTERCFLFIKSLENLPEFNQFISQLCIFSLQNGRITEFIKLMKMFGHEKANDILSKLDKNILAILATTFSIDSDSFLEISELFYSFDSDLQTQILITSSPSEFLKIIHNENYKRLFFTKENISYLSQIADALIWSMEWSKLERLWFALIEFQIDIDLPSKFMAIKELNSLHFEQTIEIIQKDNFKWNDEKILKECFSGDLNQKEFLKHLGSAFTMADLGQWAASCFCVMEDKNRCKFVLVDKPEIIDDVNRFLNDENSEEKMSHFLRSIINELN